MIILWIIFVINPTHNESWWTLCLVESKEFHQCSLHDLCDFDIVYRSLVQYLISVACYDDIGIPPFFFGGGVVIVAFITDSFASDYEKCTSFMTQRSIWKLLGDSNSAIGFIEVVERDIFYLFSMKWSLQHHVMYCCTNSQHLLLNHINMILFRMVIWGYFVDIFPGV